MGRFPMRVVALIPAAIALNIALGYTVGVVLRLPIYLDSIGTILVGVLAGPLAGAATGALTDLIWQYAPVIGGGTIGPFAVVAAVLGLLAGLWGRIGVFRPRPASGRRLALAAAVAAGLVVLVVLPILGNPAYTDPSIGGYPGWVYLSAGVIALALAVSVAGFVGLRRDLAGAWVAGAGVVTGIVAALVAAPIAAGVFGGVTGSGADLIVAALRQGGSDVLHASLGQGLFSDPIDKTITCFVVYLVLAAAPPRLIARFPNGERLVGPGGLA